VLSAELAVVVVATRLRFQLQQLQAKRDVALDRRDARERDRLGLGRRLGKLGGFENLIELATENAIELIFQPKVAQGGVQTDKVNAIECF
jgi:hypothetical protein